MVEAWHGMAWSSTTKLRGRRPWTRRGMAWHGMVFDNKASWQEAMDVTAAPLEMMLKELPPAAPPSSASSSLVLAIR
jgi:hypothetical protein